MRKSNGDADLVLAALRKRQQERILRDEDVRTRLAILKDAIALKKKRNYQGAIIAEQLDIHGKVEYVDLQKYSMHIICKCGEVRFVQPKNFLEITECKPCAHRGRRSRYRKSLIRRGRLDHSELRYCGELIAGGVQQ